MRDPAGSTYDKQTPYSVQDLEGMRGTVLQLPVRDQIDLISDGTIDPQLIVELYSK